MNGFSHLESTDVMKFEAIRIDTYPLMFYESCCIFVFQEILEDSASSAKKSKIPLAVTLHILLQYFAAIF